MEQSEIETKLAQMVALQNQITALEAERETAINNLIPAEIKDWISMAERDFGFKLAAVGEALDALEKEIRADVLAFGATVKVPGLQAVWNKPRVTWNNDKLEGFAASHPEILSFRTIGAPTITMRKAGEK